MKSLVLVAFIFLGTISAQAHNSCAALFESSHLSKIFVTKTGERMAYRTYGDLTNSKNVIVMLNGLSADMSQWDRARSKMQNGPLGPESFFVQIDLLGEGETADLNPLGPATEIHFDKQVRLLHELISSLHVDQRRLVLSGHSYGGGIAARYVRDFPGEVRDAILVAPFVDHLETWQPGVGPTYAWMKTVSEIVGAKALYENMAMSQSWLAMLMTWPAYGFMTGSKAKLGDIVAMTRGNRELEMSESIRKSGTTRVSLIISGADEMVPMAGHLSLWSEVPADNRGQFAIIPSPHDSVANVPTLIAHHFESILK